MRWWAGSATAAPGQKPNTVPQSGSVDPVQSLEACAASNADSEALIGTKSVGAPVSCSLANVVECSAMLSDASRSLVTAAVLVRNASGFFSMVSSKNQ